MTIDVPIRPGAVLNDPETRRFVEENILNAKYSWIMQHSYIPDRAYNKDGIVNILANYPWQEYGYKYGRWQRELLTQLPFIPWRAWEKKLQTLMLTDPTTGREIAELYGMAIRVRSPSGGLLFAGDPHYAGVLSTVRDGERRVCIVGNIRLASAEATYTVAARARDLTKTMVPGHPPQVRLYDPPQEYLKYLGPWLADHPDKPSKRG